MKNPLPAILREMREVTWPTREELLYLSIFVVVVCAIIAVIMLGLDLFLIEVREYLLNL